MAIGRTNCGGGAALNFEVKAYASLLLLPASAKENSIAIITDLAMSEFMFAYDRPTTRSNGAALSGGEVWLFNDTIGIYTVNALKKNMIKLYPSSKCEQYNAATATWVAREVRLFRNGAWQELFIYYFNNGDNTPLTGGWAIGQSSQGHASVSSAGGIWLSHERDDSVKPTASATTNNAIDLTNIKTIYIYCTVIMTNPSVTFEVRNASSAVASIVIGGGGYSGGVPNTFTLDVRTLTGQYYLRFVLNGIKGLQQAHGHRTTQLWGI